MHVHDNDIKLTKIIHKQAFKRALYALKIELTSRRRGQDCDAFYRIQETGLPHPFYEPNCIIPANDRDTDRCHS